MMLTCPNRNVSRSGSNAIANAAASPIAYHRTQRSRRMTGSSSHAISTTEATTQTTQLTTMATFHGSTAIGSMEIAANGG